MVEIFATKAIECASLRVPRFRHRGIDGGVLVTSHSIKNTEGVYHVGPIIF